jgi:hypothetical protein
MGVLVLRDAEQASSPFHYWNKNEEKIQLGIITSDEIANLRDKWGIIGDKSKKIRLCEQSRLPL